LLRKLTLAAFAAALLAAPAVAQDETPSILHGGQSSPNFLGATGLLLTPSAYTVGDRGISGHAYFTDPFNSFGVQAGITSRFEVGLTFLDGDDEFGDDSEVILNAKAVLLRESFALPQISVGVMDAFDGLDVDPSWYFVASKDLSRILPLSARAHFGYGGGLFDNDVFAGLEVGIGTPLDILPVSHPSFSFLAEYANDDVNLGLRGRWKGFAATIGLLDFDDFGFGVSYTTGLRLR
jgi:hypothetical protein